MSNHMRGAAAYAQGDVMAKVNTEAELAAKLAEIVHTSPDAQPSYNRKNALQIARDAARLCSMARAHHRLAETACNRELTVREIKREENIQMDILALLTEYGFDAKDIRFGGDPRGYTVKVHFPDGRGNTWGGDAEGWGI